MASEARNAAPETIRIDVFEFHRKVFLLIGFAKLLLPSRLP
jgi:hypothetical protein